jgi:hypothetical protein
MIFSLLVVRTPFVDWLWYNGYPELYNKLALLKINAVFLTYMGSWALPIFVATAIGYWMMETEDEIISSQYLLVPIAYVPFSLVVTMVANMQVDFTWFYIHPLVIIPAGYVYIFMWIIIIWVLEKIKLVA